MSTAGVCGTLGPELKYDFQPQLVRTVNQRSEIFFMDRIPEITAAVGQCYGIKARRGGQSIQCFEVALMLKGALGPKPIVDLWVS